MSKYKLRKLYPGLPKSLKVGDILTGGDGWMYRWENREIGEKSISSEEITFTEFFSPYVFTTEDGVDIYSEDLFYFIAYEEVWLTMANVETDCRKYGKTFFTEKAAQEYLDSLKSKYKEGDYVVLSIGDIEYMGVYNKMAEHSTDIICKEWILYQSGQLVGPFNTCEGRFSNIKRLMTQHEIFEYLIIKNDVKNKWPINSKIELINDVDMNAYTGATGTINGYILLDSELLLNIEWCRPTPCKYGGNSSQKHGGYPIKIFKPI